MYEGMMIALIILGICTILWSYYKDQYAVSTPHKTKNDNVQEQYEEYGARIDELNRKILELNEYSEFMRLELDKKHKELLFLYQLINEKTKEIKGQNEVTNPINDGQLTLDSEQNTEKVMVNKTEQQKSNHNKMILQLSERGYLVKDIAQMLDIGQGEVKLVLNLFE